MTTNPYDAGVVLARSDRVPRLPPVVPDIPAVAVPEIALAAAEVPAGGKFTEPAETTAELFALAAERSAAQSNVQTWNARRTAIDAEMSAVADRLEALEGELLVKRRAIVRGELAPSGTAPALAEKAEAEATLAELRAQLDVVSAEQAEAQRAYQATAQRAGAAEFRAQADALVAEAAASDALIDSLLAPLVAAANARAEIEARGRELARQIRQHDEDQPVKVGAFDPSPTFLRWPRIPAANLPRRFRYPEP